MQCPEKQQDTKWSWELLMRNGLWLMTDSPPWGHSQPKFCKRGGGGTIATGQWSISFLSVQGQQSRQWSKKSYPNWEMFWMQFLKVPSIWMKVISLHMPHRMDWISRQRGKSGASKFFFSVSPPWGLSCVNSQRQKHCTWLGILKSTNESRWERQWQCNRTWWKCNR